MDPSTGAPREVDYPLAYCPKDGFFPVPFNIRGYEKVVFEQSLAHCSKCGDYVEILDATYQTVGKQLQVLFNQKLTAVQLRELLRITKQVKEEKITEEEAKEKAALVSPEAAKIYDFSKLSITEKATLLFGLISSLGVLVEAAEKVKSGSAPEKPAQAIEITVNVPQYPPAPYYIKSGSVPMPVPRPPRKK